MSDDAFEALIQEIGRIVHCPYPTQLKALRDLLSRRCTTDHICRWAASKPCQIAKVAQCVLAGLQRWPYVLDIVIALSQCAEFRDSLLSHRPTLLQEVVVAANQRSEPNSKYTATAVALLSHPLAQRVALPSEVQTLFIRLFAQAAEEPSVATIRPIWHVLKGTSTLLLGLLTTSVLLQFANHLFDILRNLKGHDPSLSLYCIAIMKIMAQASGDLVNEPPTSSYDTQELLASTQPTPLPKWQPETVQQYFTERKAQKTMQLVVLRVMWACTPSTGESSNDKAESLRLANEIITAVPTTEREVWRKANALIPRKFEEKVFSPALEPELRFHALCFLLQLAEGSTQSVAVMERIRYIIHQKDGITCALRDFPQESASLLVRCGIFDENTTTMFLQDVVDFAARTSPDEVPARCRFLRQLLQQLSNAVLELDAISQGALLALDVLSCGPRLQHLARVIDDGLTVAHHGRDICSGALQDLRNGLIHDLSRMFLTAAMSSAQQSYSISPVTLASLLNLHASSAKPAAPCVHQQQTSNALHSHESSIAFVEAESTPDEPNTDWRTAVRSELMSRVNADHDRLIELFSRSCAELEARCDEAERPLREERQRSISLQQKHDVLQQAYATLETESIDRALQLDALEAERDQGLADLDTLRAESGALENTCRELEQRLIDADQISKQTLEQVTQARDASALAHSVVLAEKEANLEDLQKQLYDAGEELRVSRNKLSLAEAEQQRTMSTLASLKDDYDELNALNQEQASRINSLSDTADGLAAAEAQLQSHIESLDAERSRQKEEHRNNSYSLELDFTNKLSDAEARHQEAILSLTTQHGEALQEVMQQLGNAKEEILQRHDMAERSSEAQLTEKQEMIDRLHRKCKGKDRSIAQANAMRTNLMAAMGFDAERPHRALPRHSTRSSIDGLETHDDADYDDPSPPTPCSGDDIEAVKASFARSFGSTASSIGTKSGPTPKRARPQRPRKDPSAHKVSSEPSTVTRSTRSVAKRLPLLDISSTTAANGHAPPRTPSNGAGKLGDPDETTFDGSELFTSTAARGPG